MVTHLFVNFCILVTLTTAASFLIDEQPDPPRTWRGRFLHWGASIGAGWVLLQFPLRLEGGVLLAFHGVAPALSGLYGGPGWGLVVGAALAAYRFWLGGIGAIPGVVHLLTAGLVAGLLAVGGRGFTLPLAQLSWRAALIFLPANTSLLLISTHGPEIFRQYALPLTMSQAFALLVGIWVMRTRFVARRHLELMTDLSLTDHLTGLSNLRGFEEAVDRLSDRDQGSFLLLDVDHFKQVNDHHGHLNGDKVLRRVAEILRNETRQTDLICRYGGEEFAVLMRNCPPDRAQHVAERIRAAIERAGIPAAAGTVQVTVSGGLIPFEGGLDFQEQFAEADRRLYRAKELGRNRIESV